jgi:ribonuclease HI
MNRTAKYYAVAVGRTPGVIYRQWSDCEPQIRSFPGAKYKSFATEAEAQAWLQANTQEGYTVQPTSEENQLLAYTDGSARDGIGGWSVVFVWNGDVIMRWSGLVPGTSTNNIAELYAIQQVVYSFNDLNVPSVVIYTDSEYALKSLTLWINSWRRSGWISSKGTPVSNREIIEPLADELAQLGSKVSIKWVAGHSGNPYNEEADRLANAARMQHV